MDKSVALRIEEIGRMGEARRLAAGLAGQLGFDADGCGKVSLVVTEAANNLARHAADGGEILLRPLRRAEKVGLEVMALDRGPGIADIGRCLGDGYSTIGTPGTGLGAMRRLSDEFDLHSLPGVGTAVLCRLWARPVRRAPAARAEQSLEIGLVCLAVMGEQDCGDACAVWAGVDWTRLLLADGLGHGPQAAEASAAVTGFLEEPSPLELLQAAHAGLRHTRGAAVAVADVGAGEVRYAGVGNIAGAIIRDSETRHMVSYNGTIGHQLHKVQEFVYPWPAGALLVMHTDGLGTHWRLDRYAGLAARHPSLIAGVLYRDFCRGRDDVAVLVARAGGTGA